MSQGNSVEQDKKALHTQIEALKESKRSMQKNMGEQLNSLKNQLESLKEDRKKCEEAIRVVTIENERLQKICETEQKRNYELIAKYKKKKLEGF